MPHLSRLDRLSLSSFLCEQEDMGSESREGRNRSQVHPLFCGEYLHRAHKVTIGSIELFR